MSLALALVVGFSIAAHLGFVIAFGFPVSVGFTSFVQAHGHVQLMGWVGLFVMGISLHFLPRLAGSPIQNKRCLKYIAWLVGCGLVLRSVGSSALPYVVQTQVVVPLAWSLVVSGLLVWAGIFGYIFIVMRLLWQMSQATRRAFAAVRPFLALTVAGWLLYGSLNFALLIHMAIGKFVVVDPAWNQFAIQCFVNLVLLPVAFVFSIRTFPLYLRLPVPGGWVKPIAYIYLTAVLMQLLPTLPPAMSGAAPVVGDVAPLGMMLKGAVIIGFVWKLDVLTRLRQPWTVNRAGQPGPHRRPTRPGLPDYGEFGRFERLVYAAYTWLLLAAGADMTAGAGEYFQLSFTIPSNVRLHIYLMGFASLLIFGMAVRMVPGFIQKRQVAMPALVSATFWLGNAATMGRLFLYMLPVGLLKWLPGLLPVARTLFALSGLLGMAAVACLAVNLWRTRIESLPDRSA
jgi:uncharacterized protein involved in response to NO